MSKSFSFDLFNSMPIVGIMRNVGNEHLTTIAEIYYRSGLTNLEITMNSADAGLAIRRLSDQYGEALNIGAGTVCSMDDLEAALNAGAQFIVTPIINEEVIKSCTSRNIPIFPGAYTPSEIYRAWYLGATMVKLFPASDLKPGYIKEVLAPLNFVKLMPTGGIGIDNFTDFFSAGASAAGIGSYLFPKDIIARQDWAALEKAYLELAERYRRFNAIVS